VKLIILDRDGVINFDSRNYIRTPDDWIPIPGSLDAIAKLHAAGYTIAVATNQSGIARGYYDHDTLSQIHEKMQTMVKENGGHIDKIVYCPHMPDSGCPCRKPAPGMLLDIAKHYQCSLDGVRMIGDTDKDVGAAQAAGATPCLVKTHYKPIPEPQRFTSQGIPIYANLQSAVSDILT